jgi:hypothetical protein
VVEAVQAIAKAHALRHGEAQGREREPDSLRAGRDPEVVAPRERVAVHEDALDVDEGRSAPSGDAHGIGHGQTAARGDPDPAARIGDQAPVPLHSLDAEQAVRRAVFAHAGRVEGPSLQPIAVHA